MDKVYNEALSKLEMAINDLEIEADYSIQRIEDVINLSKVKERILKRGLNNNQEEIRFFKYQKPAIAAKLIYYNAS